MFKAPSMALMLLLAPLVGCAGEPTATEPPSATTPTAAATATPEEPTVTATATPTSNITGEDLNMKAEDFECILAGTKVNHFYVRNELGHLDEAVATAGGGGGSRYPVGTILQLIPTEAMVKRGAGFNAQTHDWEFFFLSVSASGTEIVERGADPAVGPTGVSNASANGNCFGCHNMAADPWDMVCATDHGCEPLPVTESQIELVQSRDPRCP